MARYSTFGETRRRRRHQVLWRVVRFMFGVGAVLGVGVYGYQVGVSANQARSGQLEADLVRFQRANLDLRDRIASVNERSAEAEAALESMRQRYAAEIPTGEAADLFNQVRAHLSAGVEPDRLAFLIEAAGLSDACASEPVSKRFMPRTPISTGPHSFIRFGNHVTITGDGDAARNEAGLPEAWYDPASPVRLHFQTLDGATTTVEGIVPFTHQMVVDGQEYRFSAVQGESRFIEITSQACPLLDRNDGSTASAQDIRASQGDAPNPRSVTD